MRPKRHEFVKKRARRATHLEPPCPRVIRNFINTAVSPSRVTA